MKMINLKENYKERCEKIIHEAIETQVEAEDMRLELGYTVYWLSPVSFERSLGMYPETVCDNVDELTYILHKQYDNGLIDALDLRLALFFLTAGMLARDIEKDMIVND